MKVLKAKQFHSYIELVQFVADNNIGREDILTIKQGPLGSFTLFYYALA